MNIMNSIIRAWGNSQGLYIPKKLLKELDLRINDPVQIRLVGDGILIQKDHQKKDKLIALESLKTIRSNHKDIHSSISDDYKKEMEDYLDEKYR